MFITAFASTRRQSIIQVSTTCFWWDSSIRRAHLKWLRSQASRITNNDLLINLLYLAVDWLGVSISYDFDLIYELPIQIWTDRTNTKTNAFLITVMSYGIWSSSKFIATVALWMCVYLYTTWRAKHVRMANTRYWPQSCECLTVSNQIVKSLIWFRWRFSVRFGQMNVA